MSVTKTANEYALDLHGAQLLWLTNTVAQDINAVLTERTQTTEELVRLREENRSLREQLDALQRRASESRLPLVEAIFDYDGARRYARLLGMVKPETLQVYDVGAGHVKNYLLTRIENFRIVVSGQVEALYRTTLPTSFIQRTETTGRYSQESPRSPRTIRGTR